MCISFFLLALNFIFQLFSLEIVALIELHKEMTNFSDWLRNMESDHLSSVDSEVLLTDSQLLLDVIERRKVGIVSCAEIHPIYIRTSPKQCISE